MVMVRCPECTGIVGPDDPTCWFCHSPLDLTPRLDPFADIAERRRMQRALAGQTQAMTWLRVLYRFYALVLGGLILLALAEAPRGVSGVQMFGVMLFPLTCLALVLGAIKHLESEPFAAALGMAALQTLVLASALHGDTLTAVHIALTLILWWGVFVTAHGDRVEAEWRAGTFASTDGKQEMAMVIGMALLFGGTLLAVIAFAGEGDGASILFYASLVVLGLLAGLLFGGDNLVRSLALRITPTGIALGVVVALGAFLLDWWVISMIRYGHFGFAGSRFRAPSAELFVTIAILPAVFEEWLCRGVLWLGVRQRASEIATIVCTAALFALMHGIGRPSVLGVAPQFVAGLCFGWLRARTGSLVPGMIAHAIMNTLLVMRFPWMAGG